MLSDEEINVFDGAHLAVIDQRQPRTEPSEVDAGEEAIVDEVAHDCIETVFGEQREVQTLIGKMNSDFNEGDIKALQLAFKDYNIPINFA